MSCPGSVLSTTAACWLVSHCRCCCVCGLSIAMNVCLGLQSYKCQAAASVITMGRQAPRICPAVVCNIHSVTPCFPECTHDVSCNIHTNNTLNVQQCNTVSTLCMLTHPNTVCVEHTRNTVCVYTQRHTCNTVCVGTVSNTLCLKELCCNSVNTGVCCNVCLGVLHTFPNTETCCPCSMKSPSTRNVAHRLSSWKSSATLYPCVVTMQTQ